MCNKEDNKRITVNNLTSGAPQVFPDNRINFNNGSKIEVIQPEKVVRGDMSKYIEFSLVNCDHCRADIPIHEAHKTEWKEINLHWYYCNSCYNGVFRNKTNNEND